MAKVLFINPVVREDDQPRHVPYGMALLASLAMDRGHLVQVYDANAWRLGDDVLVEVLKADDWDVVATGGITTTYAYVKKICALAKELVPGARIVLGGGLLTSMPRDIMRLVGRRAVALASIGIGAGVLLAAAAAQIAAASFVDLTPTDPVSFATIAVFCFAAAVAAALSPARHAARIQPVEALRHD